MPELKIEIKRIVVDTSPSIDIFHVTVLNDGGIWEETLSGENDLGWMLRGIEIGANMVGNKFFPKPEIPRAVSEKFIRQDIESFLEETQM